MPVQLVSQRREGARLCWRPILRWQPGKWSSSRLPPSLLCALHGLHVPTAEARCALVALPLLPVYVDALD